MKIGCIDVGYVRLTSDLILDAKLSSIEIPPSEDFFCTTVQSLSITLYNQDANITSFHELIYPLYSSVNSGLSDYLNSTWVVRAPDNSIIFIGQLDKEVDYDDDLKTINIEILDYCARLNREFQPNYQYGGSWRHTTNTIYDLINMLINWGGVQSVVIHPPTQRSPIKQYNNNTVFWSSSNGLVSYPQNANWTASGCNDSQISFWRCSSDDSHVFARLCIVYAYNNITVNGNTTLTGLNIYQMDIYNPTLIKTAIFSEDIGVGATDEKILTALNRVCKVGTYPIVKSNSVTNNGVQYTISTFGDVNNRQIQVKANGGFYFNSLALKNGLSAKEALKTLLYCCNLRLRFDRTKAIIEDNFLSSTLVVIERPDYRKYKIALKKTEFKPSSLVDNVIDECKDFVSSIITERYSSFFSSKIMRECTFSSRLYIEICHNACLSSSIYGGYNIIKWKIYSRQLNDDGWYDYKGYEV